MSLLLEHCRLLHYRFVFLTGGVTAVSDYLFPLADRLFEHEIGFVLAQVVNPFGFAGDGQVEETGSSLFSRFSLAVFFQFLKILNAYSPGIV